MSYLLDTHVLIWALTDPGRLSGKARQVLEKASAGDVFFASINLLEISIKYNLGKITLNNGTPEDLMRAAVQTGFRCLSLDCAETATFHRIDLPAGDPFDRLLCHLAVTKGLTLISKDSFYRKLKIKGFQWLW